MLYFCTKQYLFIRLLKSNKMENNYSIKLKKPFFTSFFKKNKNFLLLFVIVFASNIGVSQSYCTAAATDADDDDIFNVTFGSLNNTSSCNSLGGPGSIKNMYSNYTNIPAPVVFQGSNYPLSVTVGMCGTLGYSGRIGVWIDYNQNGVFTDPGETIVISAYTAFAVAGTSVSLSGGVTIPMTALPGTTRMRIIETESSTAPGPCTNPSWGEVEDYNVTIVAPSPLDLGISAFVKPLSSKICYTSDTIIATLKNYGTLTADFSINQTTLTVNSTGPNASTYTLALTSGTLAANATQNFTLSTNYSLTNIGTYKLKAFSTVVGDGTALNDTTNLTITRNPVFGKSILPNDSVCLGIPVQLNTSYSTSKQVGTGTIQNGGSSYPTPYGHYFGGAKHQFLYLASELTAAGIVAGNINGINFNVANLNTVVPLINYNISIATTTLSSLTTIQTAGFTSYFSSSSYAPVLGINTHTFITPYVWDGVSNIIIENCFNNNDIGPTGGNASVLQSSTAFSSSVYDYADSDPTICSSTTPNGNLSQRPNTYFIQPATITYSWSPAIELSATNIANPIANVSTTRTYTVEGTVGGCMTYDTIQIFVKPTPTPNLGNDSLFCNLPVIINANTTANSYLWSNNSVNSNLNIITPGKYWVRATNSNGCSNSDTVLVTLGQSPIVTLGPDTAFCQGKTINLYAGAGASNSYLWSTGSTASSISVGNVGTYSVVVTNSIGCVKSDIINITSKPLPTVSLVFVGTHSYCVTENIIRSLVEGVPANGTYIGAGVTNTSFNPSQAGQGNHIILYNIVGANGCSNAAKDTLIVSACVNINELSLEDFGINVYPNPSSGVFKVELNSNSDVNGILTITSIDGKLVFNEAISGNGIITKSINISHLAEGIYYLKLETKDAVRTYKVLKQ
jgi:hypothetical protein